MLGTLNQAKRAFGDWSVPPAALAELISLEASGAVSGLVARQQVLPAMWESGRGAREVVEAEGLAQQSDADALMPMVEEVLQQHPGPVAQYLEGKTKVVGFLVGQCMKASRGKGNPKVFGELLREALARRS